MEVTQEMVQALWRVLPSEVQECAASDPENVEPWVRAVLEILEREQRFARRLELRAIRREIAEINAVSGTAMRAGALTVLFNHEHEAMK